jgi:hypothetical protein
MPGKYLRLQFNPNRAIERLEVKPLHPLAADNRYAQRSRKSTIR